MAERDPETIKQEIDLARDQLASTVDSLTERANPRRLADDLKARAIEFAKKPVVTSRWPGSPRLSSWWSSAGSGIVDGDSVCTPRCRSG